MKISLENTTTNEKEMIQDVELTFSKDVIQQALNYKIKKKKMRKKKKKRKKKMKNSQLSLD